MNKLTNKQQDILNEITNEFTKINEERQKPKGKSLLGLEDMLDQRNKDLEKLEEIKAINKARKETYKQIVIDAIDKLNEELGSHGLACKYIDGYSMFRFGIGLDTEKYHYEIMVNFDYGTINVEFESDINGGYASMVGGIKGFGVAPYGASWTIVYYDTIEQFVANSQELKQALKRLLNEKLKK